MQPSYNPPGPKFYDKFGREIIIGSFVAAAGVRALTIGHVYRLPDVKKQNLSLGVKDMKTGEKVIVHFGSGYWPVKSECTRGRVLILDESYLDL